MQELAEHLGVEESAITVKEVPYTNNDGDAETCFEVFVDSMRVGTGLSSELAVKDAMVNGQYALRKQRGEL